MDYRAYDLDSFRYISHHGILGQKWGIRRYQNPDGTLTEAGKRRNYKEIKKINSKGNEPKEIPKVSANVSKQIEDFIKSNQSVFEEFKAANDAYDELEQSFYKDKKKVQENILAAYDKGVPFDCVQDKIVATPLKKPWTDPYPTIIDGKKEYRVHTHDITPSLLKLWNDKDARQLAFYWYSGSDEYRQKKEPLDQRYYAAYKEYSRVSKELTNALLGEYANKKVKTIDRKIINSPRGNYRDLRYDSAGDIVRDNMRERLKEKKYI